MSKTNFLFIVFILILVSSSCKQTKGLEIEKPILSTTNAVNVQSPKDGNPYKVERTFPDYLLQYHKLFSEKSGTYQAGDLPV